MQHKTGCCFANSASLRADPALCPTGGPSPCRHQEPGQSESVYMGSTLEQSSQGPSAKNFQSCFWSHSTCHPWVGAWDAGLSSRVAATFLMVVLQHHGAMATQGGGPSGGPGRSGEACSGTDVWAGKVKQPGHLWKDAGQILLRLLTLAPWKKSYDKPRQHIKKQRQCFADKGPSSQSYCFSSSHVWMWELDYKEGWVLKNWYFWTVVLEKTLESPLDCKEIQPVHPKGNQPWIFIGRTDAEAETPVLWPPDAKNWLIGKDSDAGKDWRLEEKGTTEGEMVGWHCWLNGHEFE